MAISLIRKIKTDPIRVLGCCLIDLERGYTFCEPHVIKDLDTDKKKIGLITLVNDKPKLLRTLKKSEYTYEKDFERYRNSPDDGFTFNLHYPQPSLSTVNYGWTVLDEDQFADSIYALETECFVKDVATRHVTEQDAMKIINTYARGYGLAIECLFEKQLDYKEHTLLDTHATISIRRTLGLAGPPKKIVISFNYSRIIPLHVVLHELAHVMDYYYTRSIAHGPSFWNTYMNILMIYDMCPDKFINATNKLYIENKEIAIKGLADAERFD